MAARGDAAPLALLPLCCLARDLALGLFTVLLLLFLFLPLIISALVFKLKFKTRINNVTCLGRPRLLFSLSFSLLVAAIVVVSVS